MSSSRKRINDLEAEIARLLALHEEDVEEIAKRDERDLSRIEEEVYQDTPMHYRHFRVSPEVSSSPSGETVS